MKHEIVYKFSIKRPGARDSITGGQCSICGLVWNTRSGVDDAESWKGFCYGVPAFDGWHNVPKHLHTKTQLKELGLREAGEVAGVCYTMNRKRSWLLYDIAKATPIAKRVKKA